MTVWLLWQNDGLLGVFAEENHAKAVEGFERVIRENGPDGSRWDTQPWTIRVEKDGTMRAHRGRIARLEIEKAKVQ